MTSWWQRLRERLNPARPTAGESQVTEADVSDYAESQVWPGFLTRSEAVESVTGYFADSVGPTDPASIEQAVDRAWRRREAALADSAEPGDWGRLDAAFAELGRSGWVARMDFTCCQTCGHAEIGDERTGDEHSYVFFHQQDTERIVGRTPRLGFCFSYFDSHPGIDPELTAAEASEDAELRARAWDQHERVETAVGATLVECLRRHGLDVDWNGSHETRPSVALRDWRKPLPVQP